MIGKNSLLFLLSHPLVKLPNVFGKGRKENTFCKKGFPHKHTPPKKK